MYVHFVKNSNENNIIRRATYKNSKQWYCYESFELLKNISTFKWKRLRLFP